MQPHSRNAAFSNLDIGIIPPSIMSALEVVIASTASRQKLIDAVDRLLAEGAVHAPSYSEAELVRSISTLLRRLHPDNPGLACAAAGRCHAVLKDLKKKPKATTDMPQRTRKGLEQWSD